MEVEEDRERGRRGGGVGGAIKAEMETEIGGTEGEILPFDRAVVEDGGGEARIEGAPDRAVIEDTENAAAVVDDLGGGGVAGHGERCIGDGLSLL